MNNATAVTTRATDFGTTTGAPPDDRIQGLRDHLGKRSIGGRFVAWVKNKGGISPKEAHYQKVLTQALKDKLGSAEAVQKVFDELDISTSKPLSARKLDRIINKADRMLQKLETDYQQQVDPGVTFSDSALALRTSLRNQLKGGAEENAIAAHQILRALDLKENEEVSPEHVALAQKLVQKYEDCRNTALYKELMSPETKFPEYFGSTFKRIIANGWDPRADRLSTEELIALHTYTQSDYVKINDELRGKRPMTTFTRTITDLAVQGMNKLPEYDGRVLRGTNLPLGKDKACVRGAIIVDAGFTSTSAGGPFPGTHQFVIKSKGGRDISFLSKHPQEKEILFPPNHQFKVIDRSGVVDYNFQVNDDSPPATPDVSSTLIMLE